MISCKSVLSRRECFLSIACFVMKLLIVCILLSFIKLRVLFVIKILCLVILLVCCINFLSVSG